MTTPCGFIDDGYTEPFTIPAVPGEAIGIAGTFRPALRGEILRFISLPQSTPDEVEAACDASCDLIARHITKWDLKDSKKKPVEITAANVARINPPRLLANLFDVVCGAYGQNEVSLQLVREIAMDTKTPEKVRLKRIIDLFGATSKAETAEATDAKN